MLGVGGQQLVRCVHGRTGRRTDRWQGQGWPRRESREAAIVAAYLKGSKVTDIEDTFGVGRSTIYHFLRRAGQLPARTQRRIDAAAKDAAIGGLYELIELQDRRIFEQDEHIAAQDKVIARLQRQLAKRSAAHNGGPDRKPGKAG